MKPTDDTNMTAKETLHFPLHKLYLLLITFLTVISLLGLSVHTDSISSGSWSLSADIRVSSITLILLLLAWLPALIPWIGRFLPSAKDLMAGLRKGGVEEIEAFNLRIRLTRNLEEAADAYARTILKPDRQGASSEPNIDQLEKSYQDTVAILNTTSRLAQAEAMEALDQLCQYYDQIREMKGSGRKRTAEMDRVASTMWALMPSISISDFPVRQRLRSSEGGERLSAYKFLESKGTADHLELLLSRAIGVLEAPFGQYNALLALRRVVGIAQLRPDENAHIVQTLEWTVGLEYPGDDRRSLMRAIISDLRQKAHMAGHAGR